MLTIFTIPKPFKGHISIIQKNAISSWMLLQPACEIILFGDDEGIAEIAQEWGVRHIVDIEKNSYGTPLLDDVFKKAHQNAHNDLLCYVNADIILLEDFLGAVKQAEELKENFLLVGQRWDVTMDFLWNFSGEHWEEEMHNYIKEHAKLHPPRGSDFFIFSRESFLDIPSFAVGRAGWDNWMIYHACECGIPVIDITQVTTVIHQNHDYQHVKQSIDNAYENPESKENRKIIGNENNVYTLNDANYILTSQGLKSDIIKRIMRYINNMKMKFYRHIRKIPLRCKIIKH